MTLIGRWRVHSGTDPNVYKYKDKKELLKSYSIYSTELTIKKLHQDLSNLVEIAKSEYFNDTLSSITKSSSNTKKSTSKQNSKNETKNSTTTPKSSTPQQKKAGRYVQ